MRGRMDVREGRAKRGCDVRRMSVNRKKAIEADEFYSRDWEILHGRGSPGPHADVAVVVG